MNLNEGLTPVSYTHLDVYKRQGCDDLFGRIKPAYSFAVGKWFTPAVGGRINYNGMAFTDGLLSDQKYHYVHADLMWNILGCRYARQEQVRWTCLLYT